jgi:hypothetical protein
LKRSMLWTISRREEVSNSILPSRSAILLSRFSLSRVIALGAFFHPADLEPLVAIANIID